MSGWGEDHPGMDPTRLDKAFLGPTDQLGTTCSDPVIEINPRSERWFTWERGR